MIPNLSSLASMVMSYGFANLQLHKTCNFQKVVDFLVTLVDNVTGVSTAY